MSMRKVLRRVFGRRPGVQALAARHAMSEAGVKYLSAMAWWRSQSQRQPWWSRLARGARIGDAAPHTSPTPAGVPGRTMQPGLTSSPRAAHGLATPQPFSGALA